MALFLHLPLLIVIALFVLLLEGVHHRLDARFLVVDVSQQFFKTKAHCVVSAADGLGCGLGLVVGGRGMSESEVVLPVLDEGVDKGFGIKLEGAFPNKLSLVDIEDAVDIRRTDLGLAASHRIQNLRDLLQVLAGLALPLPQVRSYIAIVLLQASSVLIPLRFDELNYPIVISLQLTHRLVLPLRDILENELDTVPFILQLTAALAKPTRALVACLLPCRLFAYLFYQEALLHERNGAFGAVVQLHVAALVTVFIYHSVFGLNKIASYFFAIVVHASCLGLQRGNSSDGLEAVKRTAFCEFRPAVSGILLEQVVGAHGFLQKGLLFLAIGDTVWIGFKAIGSLASGLDQALEAVGSAKVGEVASAIECRLMPFRFIQGLVIPLNVLTTPVMFVIFIGLAELCDQRLLGHRLGPLTDLLVDRQYGAEVDAIFRLVDGVSLDGSSLC